MTAEAVMITGAGARLGRALALDLASAGHDIVAHYNRSRGPAESLKADVTAMGRRCDLVSGDLADPAAVDALVEAVERLGEGRSLHLINNAAAFGFDLFGETDGAALARFQQVNMIAPVLLAQRVLAGSTQGVPRTVINILDAKLKALNPDYFAYSLAKVSLAGATTMMARQMGDRGRVYGLSPSMILESGPETTGRVARLKRMNALKRPVDPDHVCQAARLCLSGAVASGEIITLDAGQFLLRLPREVGFLDERIEESASPMRQ
ncbi:SDR family oxidoreductase [Yunchengibacter salinarum]|uniref:SDR family oxidoreductase n=1 Tax=Yunchengibacter salinarum TaxID=3133399 RepID=UPI0035B63335